MTDPEGRQPEVSAGQRQGRGSNRNQPDSTFSQEIGQKLGQNRFQCEQGIDFSVSRGLIVPCSHLGVESDLKCAAGLCPATDLPIQFWPETCSSPERRDWGDVMARRGKDNM